MLTQSRLKELLSYDRASGIFRWKVSRSRQHIGDQAGTKRSDGYIKIGIDGDCFLAHRLAVFYETGIWPPEETDHRFGIRSDNRFAMLRVASSSQNKFNSVSGRNTSGHRGVSYQKDRRRWRAFITVKGKVIQLGRFKKKTDAISARNLAVIKHQGEFSLERSRWPKA